MNLRNWMGAAVLVGCGSIALYRFTSNHVIPFLLISLRDFVIAVYFLKRFEKNSGTSRRIEIMSYVSAILPMFYLNPNTPLFNHAGMVAQILAIIGYTLSTVALFDLGKSFGIAPAVRGETVRSGLYRFVNHPMYIGYTVAEVGMVFLNPINAVIYVLSVGLYVWRAREEDNCILSYSR